MSGFVNRFSVAVALRGAAQGNISFSPTPDLELTVLLSPFLQGDPGPVDVGAQQAAPIGDPDTDYVAVFNTGLI